MGFITPSCSKSLPSTVLGRVLANAQSNVISGNTTDTYLSREVVTENEEAESSCNSCWCPQPSPWLLSISPLVMAHLTLLWAQNRPAFSHTAPPVTMARPVTDAKKVKDVHERLPALLGPRALLPLSLSPSCDRALLL